MLMYFPAISFMQRHVQQRTQTLQ